MGTFRQIINDMLAVGFTTQRVFPGLGGMIAGRPIELGGGFGMPFGPPKLYATDHVVNLRLVDSDGIARFNEINRYIPYPDKVLKDILLNYNYKGEFPLFSEKGFSNSQIIDIANGPMPVMPGNPSIWAAAQEETFPLYFPDQNSGFGFYGDFTRHAKQRYYAGLWPQLKIIEEKNDVLVTGKVIIPAFIGHGLLVYDPKLKGFNVTGGGWMDHLELNFGEVQGAVISDVYFLKHVLPFQSGLQIPLATLQTIAELTTHKSGSQVAMETINSIGKVAIFGTVAYGLGAELAPELGDFVGHAASAGIKEAVGLNKNIAQIGLMAFSGLTGEDPVNPSLSKPAAAPSSIKSAPKTDSVIEGMFSGVDP